MQKALFHTESENVAKEALEEPDKSSKGNSEIKKTWGFRQSTVAKREMPVEGATDSPENRCPVRRSGRQPKRTDKLEEFLLTTKRGSRKSAPLSLESGDPPSQTPTDAETASEASFDGNADTKIVEDKAESPERRTRSSIRKPPQRNTPGGRQTRGGGKVTVKDEGSSENEEDSRDAPSNDQLLEKTDAKSPEDEGSTNTVQPELDSEKTGVDDESQKHGDKNNKLEAENETDKETDDDSADKPAAVMVKRGPIRTYVNKKKAVNKNATMVTAAAHKSAALVKRETKSKAPQASRKTRQTQAQEANHDENDDENDSSTSSSSSSIESDDGGYDPNALYCICRQRHNKRYFVVCCLNPLCHHYVGWDGMLRVHSVLLRFLVCVVILNCCNTCYDLLLFLFASLILDHGKILNCTL